jgi:hypothetical protein
LFLLCYYKDIGELAYISSITCLTPPLFIEVPVPI